MTQAAADVELIVPSGVSTGMRRFGTELVGIVWTPLRLLLRHLPVLLALGIGAVALRGGFIRAAVWAAGLNAYFGFAVFLLAPVTLMLSLVLMLRVVQPSLVTASGLGKSVSLLRNLGSVLIPFVAFYMAFGQFEVDYRDYDAQLFDAYKGFGALLNHQGQSDVSVPLVNEPGANIVPLLVIVASAFLLRWVLDKWKLTKRVPILGLPAVYLESLWVLLGGLYVIKQWVDASEVWAGQRVAWHAVLDWWHGFGVHGGAVGQVFHTVDDWVVTAFPSGNVTRIFLVPITGLVAAAVVYNVQTTDITRPVEAVGKAGWLRASTSGVAFAVNRRFAPLVQGVRAMIQGGAVPIMFFCLSVVVLEIASQWLAKMELDLIGPHDARSVWTGFDRSITGFNTAITYVVLVCLLAAAVDGIARRTRAHGSDAAAGNQPDVVRQ